MLRVILKEDIEQKLIPSYNHLVLSLTIRIKAICFDYKLQV